MEEFSDSDYPQNSEKEESDQNQLSSGENSMSEDIDNNTNEGKNSYFLY